jgi:hypothetical protein
MGMKIKKTGIKLAIFALIVTFVLWLIPVGLAFGDTGSASIEELQQAVTVATTNVADAQAASADSAAALATAEQALAAAQSALDNAVEGDDLAVLQEAVTVATTALADAQTASADSAAALAAAQAALADAQAALDAALLNEGTGSVEDPPVVLQEEPIATLLQPALATDKGDYGPGETVAVSGTGFLPETAYTIVITRPDGSIITGDGSYTAGSDTVTSDINGAITYSYILDGISGEYLVEARDGAGTTVATTKFNDTFKWCTISIHKYGEYNGIEGQQPCEPNICAKFKLQFSVLGFIWFDAYWTCDKWTDGCGNVSFPAVTGFLYRIIETDRDPAFCYTDTLPKVIPDCKGDRIWCDKCYIVSNCIEPKRCEVRIIKLIDGQPATEGSFDFTVTKAEAVKDTGLNSANISVVSPIPESFTLDGSNGYTAVFDVDCGVEYTITEEGPPSGFTFGSIVSDIPDNSINGQSIKFTANCCNIIKENKIYTETEQPVEAVGTITFDNTKIPGQLRLQKVSSTNALQAVANATYEVRDSGGTLVALVTTAADGWAIVSLPWGTYSVKEVTAPAGYDLDPVTYTVIIGASTATPWLYVKDNPSTGGGGNVTVAGLTEGVQVLAFTGIDPVLPISGGTAIAGGLAMLLATTLRRRKRVVQDKG